MWLGVVAFKDGGAMCVRAEYLHCRYPWQPCEQQPQSSIVRVNKENLLARRYYYLRGRGG